MRPDLTIAALAVALLTACAPIPPGADGVPPEVYIPQYAASVAQICARAGFDPETVRARLPGAGFVRTNRGGGDRFERFPDGAAALTQGAIVPYGEPCTVNVNARYAQEAVDAVGTTLIAEGFARTEDQRLFTRDGRTLRMQALGSALGGLYPVRMTLLD